MFKKKRKMMMYGEYLVSLYPPTERELSEVRVLQPRSVTMQITDACNLCCTYCYQGNKGNHIMPISVAKKFIDNLLAGEYNEYFGETMGVILDFIGGEPFLAVDLMDEIVDYFRSRTLELNHPWQDKYMISVCSNGVLYNDPKVQQFLQKNRGHLSFSVTVDGTKTLHDSCRIFEDGKGSYDLAHAAAKDWMDRGNYMGSKITLAPANVEYMDQCFRQMILDGYEDINANFVFEDGWTIEHAREVYKQAKSFVDWMRDQDLDPYDYAMSFFSGEMGAPMSESQNDNSCGGTGMMLAVDYKGDLFPCLRYMESSLNNEQNAYIIGNIEKGIAYDKCTHNCVSCLKSVTRRSQSTDECFYCPVASGCSWCSAYNYQTYGTADRRTTYICKMHMAQSLAINYYWNSYYKEHPELNQVADLWLPREWAIEIINGEEYDFLKELTLSLGGIVNESLTSIKKFDINNRESMKGGIYHEQGE